MFIFLGGFYFFFCLAKVYATKELDVERIDFNLVVFASFSKLEEH